ncbi:MAG: PIN domain-containing protein [bacterium]
MTKEIALDTSVLVPYFKNDSSIVIRLEDIDIISIPFFVIGEMMIGFSYTVPSDAARREFEIFLTHANILGCNRNVADKYGEIFAYLNRKGSLIPTNDIWIAACCLTAGVPLATRDNHFQRIPDLKVEMW